MITISNAFQGFKEMFRDFLTVYMRRVDTYKDNNGQGLFERYMVLFGESIDIEQASQIDNYLDIIDASICDEKYLNHISDVLGNPPDIFKDINQYRNLLLYITNVYKVKGTNLGYQLFFYILGFDVWVTDIEPLVDPLQYDHDEEYDDNLIFDRETCPACSYYNITIKQIDYEQYSVDSSTIALLRNAIVFNEPINARLNKFIIILFIVDEINGIELEDGDLTYETDTHYLYDTPLTYDEDKPIYDIDEEEE